MVGQRHNPHDQSGEGPQCGWQRRLRLGVKVTEDEQRFLDAVREYIAPILGSLTVGAMGYFAGRKKINAEAEKIETDAEVARLDSLSRNFQSLIDGYERRIEDLTSEVEALRQEVRQLRQALDKRPRV